MSIFDGEHGKFSYHWQFFESFVFVLLFQSHSRFHKDDRFVGGYIDRVPSSKWVGEPDKGIYDTTSVVILANQLLTDKLQF